MEKYLRDELTELLKRHSIENKLENPDFILSRYMMDCLESFDRTTLLKNYWYGKLKEEIKSNNPDAQDK